MCVLLARALELEINPCHVTGQPNKLGIHTGRLTAGSFLHIPIIQLADF
jgi:hypothetical protein